MVHFDLDEIERQLRAQWAEQSAICNSSDLDDEDRALMAVQDALFEPRLQMTLAIVEQHSAQADPHHIAIAVGSAAAMLVMNCTNIGTADVAVDTFMDALCKMMESDGSTVDHGGSVSGKVTVRGMQGGHA